MFNKLPSPSSLRTFEVAARHLSFKQAATELNVTPTAVSHQIRSLEEFLNIALFIRRTRAVELTGEGQRLAKVVHNAFADINHMLEELKAEKEILRISTTPAFATLFLAPLLDDFHQHYPDISVQLSMGIDLIDISTDHSIDLVLRYGANSPPEANLCFEKLVQEKMRAYVAPAQQKDYHDLSKAPLLETEWQQQKLARLSWADLLAQEGTSLKVTRFNDENFVVQAAIAGQGVALLSDVLAKGLIERNLLVLHKGEIDQVGYCYGALCRKEDAEIAKVRVFLAWLKAMLYR